MSAIGALHNGSETNLEVTPLQFLCPVITLPRLSSLSSSSLIGQGFNNISRCKCGGNAVSKMFVFCRPPKIRRQGSCVAMSATVTAELVSEPSDVKDAFVN